MDGVRVVLDIASVGYVGLRGIESVNNAGYGFSVFSLNGKTSGLRIDAINSSDNLEGGIYISACEGMELWDSMVLNPSAVHGDYFLSDSSLAVYSTVHRRAEARVLGQDSSLVSLRHLHLTLVWQDGSPVAEKGVYVADDSGEEIISMLTDELGSIGVHTIWEWAMDPSGTYVRESFQPMVIGDGWSIAGPVLSLDKDHDRTLVIVDNIPPVMVIETPIDGEELNGTSIDVTGTCLDQQAEVAMIQVTMDEEPDWDAKEWLEATGTTSWSYSFDDLADGTYNIFIRAFDRPNHPHGEYSRVVILGVTVDNVPPWLTVDSPIDGILTNEDNILVEGEVEQSSYVFVGGTLAQVLNQTFTATIALEEGSNVLPIVAVDGAGNTKRVELRITLDTIPPTLEIQKVHDGKLLVDSEDPEVNGWTEPDSRVSISVRGSQTDLLLEPDGSFSYRAHSIEEGTKVVVEAIDPTGNFNRLELRVKLVEDDSAHAIPAATIAAGVVFGGTMVALGLAAGVESFRYSLLVSIAPLYARLKREEVLDNRARYLLHGLIIDNPGIHYRALLKEFGLSNGITAYHLDVLEREGYIRSVRDGRLRRFYSSNVKVPVDRRLTPNQLCDQILHLVEEVPGISQKQIVEEFGLSRRVVGYHLNELVEKDRLRAAPRGRNTVYTIKRRRGTRGSIDEHGIDGRDRRTRARPGSVNK
jgi:DNA-binding transcriptional ArsR family regulator